MGTVDLDDEKENTMERKKKPNTKHVKLPPLKVKNKPAIHNSTEKRFKSSITQIFSGLTQK